MLGFRPLLFSRRWSALYCRRCCSPHLLRLEKKLPQDNEVFRCQECGFLFSPSGPDRTDRLGQPASDCGLEASDSRLLALSGSGPGAIRRRRAFGRATLRTRAGSGGNWSAVRHEQFGSLLELPSGRTGGDGIAARSGSFEAARRDRRANAAEKVVEVDELVWRVGVLIR